MDSMLCKVHPELYMLTSLDPNPQREDLTSMTWVCCGGTRLNGTYRNVVWTGGCLEVNGLVCRSGSGRWCGLKVR